MLKLGATRHTGMEAVGGAAYGAGSTQDILGFRCRLTLLTKLPTSLGDCYCRVRALIGNARRCECGEEASFVGDGRAPAAAMPMIAATLVGVARSFFVAAVFPC
jgi:hypothetical protein